MSNDYEKGKPVPDNLQLSGYGRILRVAHITLYRTACHPPFAFSGLGNIAYPEIGQMALRFQNEVSYDEFEINQFYLCIDVCSLDRERFVIRVNGGKMYESSEILNLQTDSQMAIKQIVQRLSMNRFKVMRSFDLKIARAAHEACTCPHHGTDQCDCQMVVLLVYGQDNVPVSLVVQGNDGQTQISLVDAPDQHSSRQTRHMLDSILQELRGVDESYVRESIDR